MAERARFHFLFLSSLFSPVSWFSFVLLQLRCLFCVDAFSACLTALIGRAFLELLTEPEVGKGVLICWFLKAMSQARRGVSGLPKFFPGLCPCSLSLFLVFLRFTRHVGGGQLLLRPWHASSGSPHFSFSLSYFSGVACVGRFFGFAFPLVRRAGQGVFPLRVLSLGRFGSSWRAFAFLPAFFLHLCFHVSSCDRALVPSTYQFLSLVILFCIFTFF